MSVTGDSCSVTGAGPQEKAGRRLMSVGSELAGRGRKAGPPLTAR